MSGGYYRNSYGNFSVTQNQYLDPKQGRPINASDYLPYIQKRTAEPRRFRR